MAGSFRVASGYVEITTKLDKDKIRAAAREAAAAAEAEFAAAGTVGGDRMADNASKRLRDSRGRFTAAAGDAGAGATESLGTEGTRAGDEFARRSAERLRDSRPRFTKAGDDIGRDVAAGFGSDNAFGSIFGKIGSLFSRVGSSVGSTVGPKFVALGANLSDKINQGMAALPGKLAGGLGTLLGKFGGIIGTALGFVAKWGSIVGGGLQVVPPILSAIAGGLAAIPALAVGAAGALATLGFGFHGIGAAIGEVFNPQGGGGGGGANTADQVAAAERRLTLAQRAAADAQTNLNKAREEAVNDLIDMNLQLARAHLDEQGAILQVKQAEIDLANARDTTADPLATQRARLALLEANQGLQEAKQHTVELQQSTDKANAAGVEGSDKVQAALEQQQSATFSLIDAQDALKQASVSAGGGAASAYSKLSANAKAFVDEIRRLKPELVDLQQYVQDRLFAGLDKKLDTWAHQWLPQLRRDMGDLAGSANTFAKRLGDDLSKPEIRAAVDGVFASMERVLDKFTNGGALDKLVTGFGNLVTQATPFVEKIATGIVDELGRLGDWLNKQAGNGGMAKFFSDAAHDAKQLWEIGKDVFGIISDIIGVAFGKEQKGQNGNPLDQLKDTLDKIKEWTASDSGKKTISDILQGFHDVAAAIPAIVKGIADIINTIEKAHRTVTDWKNAWLSFKDESKRALLEFELSAIGVFQKILDAATIGLGWVPGLGDKIRNAKKEFDNFALGVREDLASIPNRKDITIAVAYDQAKYSGAGPNQNAGHRMGAVLDWSGGRAFQSFAAGGVFPGVAGGLYRFAEQQTRGEMLMPADSPDMGRQQALASWAAQHADGQFTPNRGTSPQAVPAQHGPYVFQIGDHVIHAMMIDAITGNPTTVATSAQQGNRKRAYTNPRVKA